MFSRIGLVDLLFPLHLCPCQGFTVHPRRNLGKQPDHSSIKTILTSQWEAYTTTLTWSSQNLIVSKQSHPHWSPKQKPQWDQRWYLLPKIMVKVFAYRLKDHSSLSKNVPKPNSTTTFFRKLFCFWVCWLPKNVGSYLVNTNPNLIRFSLLCFFLICTVG